MCVFPCLFLFYILTVFMFGTIIIEDTSILCVHAHTDMVIFVYMCGGQNLICPALHSLPFLFSETELSLNN